jgi:hypothetical protein
METSSFIKDIGRSFLVSSFLPAAVFVIAVKVLFQDFIPSYLVEHLKEETSVFVAWFIYLAIIGWISFLLYSILPWTLRLYQGYYLPQWLKKLMEKSIKKMYLRQRKNLNNLLSIKQSLRKASDDALTQKLYSDYDKCWVKAREEYINLEMICPIDDEQLLPTRLGNLLRSCSSYSTRRYGLDGNIGWPRLLRVLPREFREDKDDNEAKLIFTLNSSLLSFILGGMLLLASFTGFLLGTFPKYISIDIYSLFIPGYLHVNSVSYLVISFIFILLGYFLYRLAVEAGENFALSVRIGFDLYRFKLLEQLNLPIPETIEQERKTWLNISEYLASGGDLGFVPISLRYFSQANQLNLLQAEKNEVNSLQGSKNN